ncbi:MAG: toll/interleukin-1 receptor domain-containing protein, partial [Clostridia bacterium]|nr:toll/interleukin-1 receptor domain-containing protein [Clostridia bacterium]
MMESIKTVELFDVSISCTRKDREIYQKIKTALESKNITVYHKSKLPENAENTIDCMLRLSRVMILVLSEHVVKDENAKRNAC